MIFITGDKHGDFKSEFDYLKIGAFCEKMGTTKKDTMVVLGDHGVRYYPDRSYATKQYMKRLEAMPISWVMIHGNHDRRAHTCSDLKKIDVGTGEVRGTFFVNPDYPSVRFTQEYGAYAFGSVRAFVIGGAYSIDKYYRLVRYAYGNKTALWFADEQLSDEEKKDCLKQFKAWKNKLFVNSPGIRYVLLSHTCPLSVQPHEAFLPNVPHIVADTAMEEFLDSIYTDEHLMQHIDRWYCGHYHTDKRIDRVQFMYHDIDLLSD